MAKKTIITTEERTDTVIRALKLIREGNSLLSAVGCKLMFDSYNVAGLFIVPAAADFPDRCEHGEADDAREFIRETCPTVVDLDGIYNDGFRGVEKVPRWWNALYKKISTFVKQQG